MFGMSCTDIVSSVAVGLSTLPLPVDIPWGPMVGTRLGNTATCEAQGFCYVFGFASMFAYNAMLGFYNTCAIAFRMEEETIRRRVEPFIHAFPLICGLVLAVLPLPLELYNPTTWDAWCSIASQGRKIGPDEDDLIQFHHKRNIFDVDLVIISMCALLFALIVIFFALIIRRVLQVDNTLKSHYPHIRRQSPRVKQRVEVAHDNTKIVVGQAFAYFASFLLTLGILLIRALIEEPRWFIKVSYLLMPLQGFFNMLIFVCYKIFNHRRKYPDESRCESLKKLLSGSLEEPIIFSRISLIEFDQTYNGVRCVDLQSEMGAERVVFDRVEGSEFGAEVIVDEEEGGLESHSKQDLSGFKFDENPSMSRGGLSGFSESISMSRGGLSGFSSELQARSIKIKSTQESEYGGNLSSAAAENSSTTISSKEAEKDNSSSSKQPSNRSQHSGWFSYMSRMS